MVGIIRKCLTVVALLIASLASGENDVIERLKLLDTEAPRPQNLNLVVFKQAAEQVAEIPEELVEDAIQERVRQIKTLGQEIASRPAPAWSYEPISATAGETPEAVMLRLVHFVFRQEAQLSELRFEIDELMQLQSNLDSDYSRLTGAADAAITAHLTAPFLWSFAKGEVSTVGGPFYTFWVGVTWDLNPAINATSKVVTARIRDLQSTESRLAEDHRTLTGNMRDWVIPGILGFHRQNREQAASAALVIDRDDGAAASNGSAPGTQAAAQSAPNVATAPAPASTSWTHTGGEATPIQSAFGDLVDRNDRWNEPAIESQAGTSTGTEKGEESTERAPTAGGSAQGSDQQGESVKVDFEHDSYVFCTRSDCEMIRSDQTDDTDAVDSEGKSSNEEQDEGKRGDGATMPLTIEPDPETGEMPVVPCLLDFTCFHPPLGLERDDYTALSSLHNFGRVIGLPGFFGR